MHFLIAEKSVLEQLYSAAGYNGQNVYSDNQQSSSSKFKQNKLAQAPINSNF